MTSFQEELAVFRFVFKNTPTSCSPSWTNLGIFATTKLVSTTSQRPLNQSVHGFLTRTVTETGQKIMKTVEKSLVVFCYMEKLKSLEPHKVLRWAASADQAAPHKI